MQIESTNNIEMTGTTIFENKKAAYFTLGCKLNFAETSGIGRTLKQLGVKTVEPGEEADICIINTCSVTEVADHKCRQAIHKLVKQHPHAFVIVTGCYAQLQPQQVGAIDGVDLVLGAEQKGELIDFLEKRLYQTKPDNKSAAHEILSVPTKDIHTFSPSCSGDDRTRYFLKVQDGCDYYCTYCTIPFARGRSRNGTIASIVSQAEQVASEGGKEIVLTGVNIGDFGKTTGENFLDLIKALDHVKGISRYRISSIEPNLLTDEIIEYCAQSRAFMPHFHIPLQSGSKEILKLMHRRYTPEFFAQKINKIKSLIPNAFIGIDVIVGTRGETEDLFEETYKFLQSLDFSQLHVFSYSERPGTQALKISHIVSPEEKHIRSQRLLDLSNHKLKAYYAQYISAKSEVLLEKSKTPGIMHGFTPNYIKVEIHSTHEADNEIVPVQLNGFNDDGTALLATIIKSGL